MIEQLESRTSDEERFRDAEQFFIKCPFCAETHPFTGISSSKVVATESELNVRIELMQRASCVLTRLADEAYRSL